MKEWARVWRWLKPRVEAAGRTHCEFDFLAHVCRGPLDPAHSKKRFKMQDLDIYTVALACRTVHDYLDGVYVYPPLGRRMDHEEMETAVLKAIENAGGLILPRAVTVEPELEPEPVFACLLRTNHLSGFIGSHSRTCTRCAEPATHHVSTGYYCANVDEGCADAIAKTHPGAVVSEGIYILETIAA